MLHSVKEAFNGYDYKNTGNSGIVVYEKFDKCTDGFTMMRTCTWCKFQKPITELRGVCRDAKEEDSFETDKVSSSAPCVMCIDCIKKENWKLGYNAGMRRTCGCCAKTYKRQVELHSKNPLLPKVARRAPRLVMPKPQMLGNTDLFQVLENSFHDLKDTVTAEKKQSERNEKKNRSLMQRLRKMKNVGNEEEGKNEEEYEESEEGLEEADSEDVGEAQSNKLQDHVDNNDEEVVENEARQQLEDHENAGMDEDVDAVVSVVATGDELATVADNTATSVYGEDAAVDGLLDQLYNQSENAERESDVTEPELSSLLPYDHRGPGLALNDAEQMSPEQAAKECLEERRREHEANAEAAAVVAGVDDTEDAEMANSRNSDMVNGMLEFKRQRVSPRAGSANVASYKEKRSYTKKVSLPAPEGQATQSPTAQQRKGKKRAVDEEVHDGVIDIESALDKAIAHTVSTTNSKDKSTCKLVDDPDSDDEGTGGAAEYLPTGPDVEESGDEEATRSAMQPPTRRKKEYARFLKDGGSKRGWLQKMEDEKMQRAEKAKAKKHKIAHYDILLTERDEARAQREAAVEKQQKEAKVCRELLDNKRKVIGEMVLLLEHMGVSEYDSERIAAGDVKSASVETKYMHMPQKEDFLDLLSHFGVSANHVKDFSHGQMNLETLKLKYPPVANPAHDEGYFCEDDSDIEDAETAD